MSVDYWWFFIHLAAEEEKNIIQLYKNALNKAVVSDSSQKILQKWRNDSELFDTDENWASSYNHFISAFIVPSFQDLGEQLLSAKAIPGWEINQNNCFDLIIVNRCSPVAALFYALKPELADKIPGFMGNMFICNNEIKQTLNLVKEIFAAIDYQSLSSRVSRLIMNSNHAYNLINVLPKALESADEKGCSLLTLAMLPW